MQLSPFHTTSPLQHTSFRASTNLLVCVSAKLSKLEKRNSHLSLISILASILARIVQAIYVVTPSASRQSELAHLEEVLDMWYMELPPPLQYNSSVKSAEPPPPNVLTLHMQYWTTVILLHRPFIPHYFSLRRKA